MRKAWTIGLLAMAGIGCGALLRHKLLSDKLSTANKASLPEGEDSFSPAELQAIKAEMAPFLLSREERFFRDLARWGTKEGIIDVADLFDKQRLLIKLKAIQEGRIKNVGKPAHLKRLDKYIQDLERWGTRQGVIDVSNDEDQAKKKKAQLKRMGKKGKAVTKRYLEAKRKEFKAQGKKVERPEDVIKHLEKDVEVTQVTVRNTSTEERTVSLWEANRSVAVSAPLATDVEDHQVVQESPIENAIHPQGIAVNPVNGFVYVVNQLSDNISIVTTEGRLIRQVALSSSFFPGLVSPVDVAVNTSQTSPNYGKVYVVGSVANTVDIINLDFQVEATLSVGVRPLAVTYNPVNDHIYVSNYVDNTVIAIHADTLDQEIINTGQRPIGMGVNTHTGEVYITGSGDHSLSIIDAQNNPITQVNDVGIRPTHLAYQPETNEVMVVASGSNQVVPIDANTFQKAAAIPAGINPFKIAYNANNDYMYVAGRDDNSLSIIAADRTIRATLDLGNINNGLAIDKQNNLLFSTSTVKPAVKVIGYQAQSSAVTVDEDIAETQRDFQNNPVVVQHARFIFSGEDRFRTLRLRKSNATGSSTTRTISFNDYQSPQNIQNVSKVGGLEGAVIDGQNGWDFAVAPGQSITMMVYYRQLDLYHMLPEKSRRVRGAEVSKGLSPNWNNPNSNYNPIQ